MDALLMPYDQFWDVAVTPAATTARAAAQHDQAFLEELQQHRYLFEPLHGGATTLDQQRVQVTVVTMQPSVRARNHINRTNVISSGGAVLTPAVNPLSRSLSVPVTTRSAAAAAAGTRVTAGVSVPASRALGNGSSTSASSTSASSPSSTLLRHSSGGFFSATASQLLSSLSASLALLGSNSRSRSSSSSSGGSGGSGGGASTNSSTSGSNRTTLGRLRSGRRHSLVLAAALLQDSEAEESYDDLLALDQFNVKRGVKPMVVTGLPRRWPTEEDRQAQVQCLICLECWVPVPPAHLQPQPDCCEWQRACRVPGACCCHNDNADVVPEQPRPAGMTMIQALPCGHEFCCSCIGAWLLDHATCPVCRWTFPDDSTHLLNMHK